MILGAPALFRDRKALVKHHNLKVIESFDPYERRLPP